MRAVVWQELFSPVATSQAGRIPFAEGNALSDIRVMDASELRLALQRWALGPCS